MPKTNEVCIKCQRKITAIWWKCCPKHTTEQGPDVMCSECALELHPELGTPAGWDLDGDG